LVLACGAVGLVVGVGFIGVGLNSGPTSYVFLGGAVLGLMALAVLPSPFLPVAFARGLALKIALLCVCLAVFIVALDPASKWLGRYLADGLTHTAATNSPAAS
jgi:hypothetical protein